jgi:hypothetical protein
MVVAVHRVGGDAVGFVVFTLLPLAWGIPHDDGPTPLGLDGYFQLDERTLRVEVGACE